jgi:plasmid replication initiation protein
LAKESQDLPAVRGLKRQVIKHTSAIQIGSSDGDISLIQRKAYNVLLAHAYDDLPRKDMHRMPISELCRYLNFDSNNTQHLKNALRGLVKTDVEWNILGGDKKNEAVWGAAALLSSVQLKGGFCYWEYSTPMRQMLYHPRIYARINLSLQNVITSKHSLILYENIFFYYRADDGFGETPWVDVADLRKLLCLKKGEYKQFKVFNSAVIKKSVEEINQKTDLQVTIEYRRSGRKVSAIKFFVKLNGENEDSASTVPPDTDKLIHRLVNNYGIAENQANQIVKEYSAARIFENLTIVDQDNKAGKIKGSLAGYAVKAIKQDYRKDRKPVERKVSVYEGMRVIFKGQEYVVDCSLSVHLDDGTVFSNGDIIKLIQTGAMRVLELLLFPGIKLLIDGNLRTLKNSYGEAVVNEENIFLTEKELKAGIKSRQYVIIEYPEMEIEDPTMNED